MRHGVRWGGVALLTSALLVGCTRTPTGTAKEKDEAQVRERFAALQGAIKAVLAKPDDADTRPLWDLLHSDTRLDADRIAEKIRVQFDKADDATKAKMSEALHLPLEKLKTYSGLHYLRSKTFLGKYDEIPESKLEKITFDGKDKAWAHYVESDEDHDRQKVEMVRQDLQWKILLPVPAFEMKLP
jgi:hypothetical protein